MRTVELIVYDHLRALFNQVDGATAVPFMGQFSPAFMSDIVVSKLQAGVPAIVYRADAVNFVPVDTIGTEFTATVTVEVYYAELNIKTAQFPVMLPEFYDGLGDVVKLLATQRIPLNFPRPLQITSSAIVNNDERGTVARLIFQTPGIDFDYEEI